MNRLILVLLWAILLSNAALGQRREAGGDVVTVRTPGGFKQALGSPRPGLTILIAPGGYHGGLALRGLHGRPDAPITIAGLDPDHKPVLRGGEDVLKISDCSYLTIENIVFEAGKDNGLNIDDGGAQRGGQARHVTLRNLVVRNIGAEGNHDGIKLSGLEQFQIDGCRVESWGSGGSAIDLVGCHEGLIENSFFRHPAGRGGNGVEAKGGSRAITIRRCRFENAGQRAVQLGGATGAKYFRPPLPERDACEARDMTVEGCTIIGSEAAVAFVGCDNCTVRYNTIYAPGKWVLRILQESRGPQFLRCRNGRFNANLVVFHAQGFEAAVNIGKETQPATFTFADNFWHCIEDPARSVPNLPTVQSAGAFGQDPLLVAPEAGDFNVGPGSPAQGVGAHALPAAGADTIRP